MLPLQGNRGGGEAGEIGSVLPTPLEYAEPIRLREEEARLDWLENQQKQATLPWSLLVAVLLVLGLGVCIGLIR